MSRSATSGVSENANHLARESGATSRLTGPVAPRVDLLESADTRPLDYFAYPPGSRVIRKERATS